MRSYDGNGYRLIVIDEDDDMLHSIIIGPGLVLCQSGRWRILPAYKNVAPIHVGPMQGVELQGYGMLERIEPGVISAVIDTGIYTYDNLQHAALLATIHVNQKPWGNELEVQSAQRRHQLKLITVDDGERTSEQYHREKDEVSIHVDCCSTVVHVPPMQTHRVVGPHTYFEASTYHPDDVVRLSDDYGRTS